VRYFTKTILFVCVHNSGRSQMAEAFFNKQDGGKAHALRFLKTYLDKRVKTTITGEGRWKSWFELPGRSYDY